MRTAGPAPPCRPARPPRHAPHRPSVAWERARNIGRVRHDQVELLPGHRPQQFTPVDADPAAVPREPGVEPGGENRRGRYVDSHDPRCPGPRGGDGQRAAPRAHVEHRGVRRQRFPRQCGHQRVGVPLGCVDARGPDEEHSPWIASSHVRRTFDVRYPLLPEECWPGPGAPSRRTRSGSRGRGTPRRRSASLKRTRQPRCVQRADTACIVPASSRCTAHRRPRTRTTAPLPGSISSTESTWEGRIRSPTKCRATRPGACSSAGASPAGPQPAGVVQPGPWRLARR